MIFDAHADIWTDVTLKRSIGVSNVFKNFHLERYKTGGVNAGIFVIWIDPPYDSQPSKRVIEIMKNMSVEINDNTDIIKIVKKFDDFSVAQTENKLAIMIGLEGLSYITENASDIDSLYFFGARHASLTWNEENMLATGVKGNPDRGITEMGIEVIKRMEKLGMIVDVSHANEKTFWDINKIATKPYIASHSNCKALCDNKRNLSDDQLRAIRSMGGVVGINAFPDFIHVEKEKRNVTNLANHIDYIAQLIGIDHVGFGFDFCDFLSSDTMSGFAEDADDNAKGLENISKVPNLMKILEQKGYSNEDISKIRSGNFMRVIKQIVK